MLHLTLITVGTLKENYLRDAVAEYQKRLGGLCQFREINLKESRLPDDPNGEQIRSALASEGKQILASIPQRSFRVALCVEGKQLSSEELAAALDKVGESHGAATFIIGSSYGLSEEVKSACDLRLSVSKLTFPHQLMRVLLSETLYRSLSILKGTRYHK